MKTYQHPKFKHIMSRGTDGPAFLSLTSQNCRDLRQELVSEVGLADLLKVEIDSERGQGFLLIDRPWPIIIDSLTWKANKVLAEWGLWLEGMRIDDEKIYWQITASPVAKEQLLLTVLQAQEKDLKRQAQHDQHAMEIWAGHPPSSYSPLANQLMTQMLGTYQAAARLADRRTLLEENDETLLQLTGCQDDPDLIRKNGRVFRSIPPLLQIKRFRSEVKRALQITDTLLACEELEEFKG